MVCFVFSFLLFFFFHFNNALKFRVVRQNSDIFSSDLPNCSEEQSIFIVSVEVEHHVLTWYEMES